MRQGGWSVAYLRLIKYFTYLLTCLLTTQGKLSEDRAKRERGRGQLVRRHHRLQRTCVDQSSRRTDIRDVAAATSGRFTSFLVTDILGIAVPRDLEPVTSSDQQHQQPQHTKSSDDFSVRRLIDRSDETSSTSMSACALIGSLIQAILEFLARFGDTHPEPVSYASVYILVQWYIIMTYALDFHPRHRKSRDRAYVPPFVC